MNSSSLPGASRPAITIPGTIIITRIKSEKKIKKSAFYFNKEKIKLDFYIPIGYTITMETQNKKETQNKGENNMRKANPYLTKTMTDTIEAREETKMEKTPLTDNAKLVSKIKNMTRKAGDFAEARAIKDDEVFNTIPTYSDAIIYNKRTSLDDCPTTMDFILETPIFFILTTDHGTYLVDTEGSTYARYIARIIEGSN